jgi:hypothetical protein
MQMRSQICKIAALSSTLTWCILVCASPPLSAQTVSDPVFGLSVTPHSGYAAQLLTPMPTRFAMIAVQRSKYENAGCLIEFRINDDDVSHTQAEFNARADKAEWIEQVRLEVADRYDIHNIDPIEHAGVRGTAIAGDRYYKRPVNVTRMPTLTREWYVILDTTKGRTTVECTALRAEFEERQVEFAAMLRTISLPK